MLKRLLLITAALLMGAGMRAEDALPAGLRMNQIQVIGTHNSYHLRKTAKPRPEWDYAHKPLDEQLAGGVRSFELDLHLKENGWHVMHVPKLDDASNCPLFSDCLKSVRAWSEAHPKHVPISFLCELKDETWRFDKTILQFDESAAARLDAEIRAVFGEGRLIEPDHIRKGAATLAEGVKKHGWPLLEEARGKVFFILHEDEALRETYTAGHPSLEGRAMFIRSEEGRPDCATLVQDNPFPVAQMQRLIREGYIIRTRADADPGRPPGPGGLTRLEAALAGGAQILSTDSPPGEVPPGSPYLVELPGGGPARCNPVNVSEGCGGAALE